MAWPKFGTKFEAGWLAMIRCADRLDLAQVVRQAGGRPEITRYESFALEGSEGDALARLATPAVKRTPCTSLLGEGDYRLVQLETPAVPPEERLQAVRWRLKDVVDFPVESAALAIADIPTEGGRQAQLFAVVATADVVGQRMAMFDKAKLALQAIDIPEMAARNVATLFEEENRGLALLLLTESDSLLSITFKGELYLSRRIDVSAQALVQADPERRTQLIERLALELQRTLDNFDRQYGFISVSRLVLASEHESAMLTAALADSLYLPVQAMDLTAVVDFPGVPELARPELQARSLLAVGAALRTSA